MKKVQGIYKEVFVCLSAFLLLTIVTYGQTDSVRSVDYDTLSLKDLLNVRIVSVSKMSELLFDAPLSASVVTKEDIRKAGSTTIMEALRLVPGIIVREQTNGNYDIHLRGMDNVPPNAPFELTSNTTTLVMIDNRPIYSYLRGGTFWETLPVDLNDVEKIEVVRGPAAALYGPNAVNGVINIITRQFKKEGLHIVANSQQGSYQTFINNASLGYNYKKLGIIASGNYQRRNRTQTSYYEYVRNISLENPDYLVSFIGDTVRNISERYPDQALAMEKYAGNVFVNYDAAEKVKFNLSAGIQHSYVQKVSTETKTTPLSTNASDSRYADLKAVVNGLSAQLSINEGTQIKEFAPGNKYDFQVMDANLEYSYNHKGLLIKPGISYRSAIYDDTRYSDTINKTGIFNAKGKIITQSAFLRGEYKLFNNKLRLIAGVAANKFNYPDTTYLSYEFAATYKLNKKHLFRLVFSQAPRSSNIYDTYVNQVIAFFPIGYQKYARYEVTGNKNLKLLTAGMIELGYRGILAPNLSIDVELFRTNAQNYNAFVQGSPDMYLNGSDTVIITSIICTNLPLKVFQSGITVSLSYTTKKLQVRPFITVQRTDTKNYAPYLNMPDAIPGAPHIYSGMGTTARLESTPTVYGGGSVNYRAAAKWNINLNAYYNSSQTYYHVSNIIFNDGVRGIEYFKPKLILNAGLSYEPVKGVTIFCNAKNLFNDRSREFFHSDAAPFMLMGGINCEF